MVYTAVLSCTLKGCDGLGVLDHAYNAPIALGIVTDRAYIPFREVLAAFAAVNVFLGVYKSLCEVLDSFRVHRHDMVSKPLRRFHADTGERSELLGQYDQWERVVVSHYLSEKAGERYSASDLAHFCLCCILNIVDSLVYSADDKILEHIDVLWINYLGLECERLDSLLACDSNLNCTAACCSGELSCLDIFLKLSDLILHLLSLLDHLVHVLSAATVDILRYSCFHFKILL